MSGTRSKRGQDDDSDVEVPTRQLRTEGEEEDKRSAILSPGNSQLTSLNGLRGRHGGDKPAELFRKDLISAMKLADTDTLAEEDFYLISDPWRQEWERGVQVPVNPESIPIANRRVVIENKQRYGGYGFKIPRKLMHAMQDDGFKQGIHELHEMHKLAEQVCRYDLDDQDVHWLVSVNEERDTWSDNIIEEWQMEKVMEELETQCHANMQVMIKTVEGLGIEYDENVVCDVCRSPESEDSNEMVFCDQCDICVHQACYGIQSIPEGNWMCRICTIGVRPTCVLCPKTGGAMKSTKSGSKWAHVSCSLWIPEVSIGCPEKMEPITRISQIPSSRWALICSLCRERTGACIQCSVKTCKTAFHVTCAFQHGLEMKTVLEEDDEEIQLKAYCGKHTKKRAEADGGTPRKDPFLTSTGSPKKECEMTEEEKTELRSHRLKKLAEEFFTCVKVPEVAIATQVEEEQVDFIYNYWLLKRKSNFNKPLLTPKTEEEDLLSKQQEDCLIARMKMFVQLRQDLERVRNLCYMVNRREKMSRTLNRLKEEIFRRQVRVVNQDPPITDPAELTAVLTAHRSSGQLFDDYEFVFKAAQDDCGGQPLITGPIDHRLDVVRPRPPGRPKVTSTLGHIAGSLNNHRRGGRPRQQPIINKTKDLLQSRLHRHHKRRLEHDKEQVDPRKLGGTEMIRRRHSDQKWAASQEKVSADTRRSLLNRRRLSDSNIARQKQRIGKFEKRTSLARARTQQKRLSSGLVVVSPMAVDKASVEPTETGVVVNTIVVEEPVVVEKNSVKSEANGVLPNRKLVIGQSIRERVQSRLHRTLNMNGLQDQAQHKIDNYFKSVEESGLEPVKPGGDRLTPSKDMMETRQLDKEIVKQESQRFKEGVFAVIGDSGDADNVNKPSKCTEMLKGNSSERPESDTAEQVIPETRAKRRRMESDLESDSNMSDRLFETVDGEVSIRSSRDTSPDRESAGITRRSSRKGLDLQRLSVQKTLDRDLRAHKRLQQSEGTEDSVQASGDDSEYAESDGSNYAPRTRRSKAAVTETMETASVDSVTSSGSKRSTRSRTNSDHVKSS